MYIVACSQERTTVRDFSVSKRVFTPPPASNACWSVSRCGLPLPLLSLPFNLRSLQPPTPVPPPLYSPSPTPVPISLQPFPHARHHLSTAPPPHQTTPLYRPSPKQTPLSTAPPQRQTPPLYSPSSTPDPFSAAPPPYQTPSLYSPSSSPDPTPLHATTPSPLTSPHLSPPLPLQVLEDVL